MQIDHIQESRNEATQLDPIKPAPSAADIETSRLRTALLAGRDEHLDAAVLEAGR